MRVSFSWGQRTDSEGNISQVPFITIVTGKDGKDELVRAATEADKSAFAAEYEAWLGPKDPPPPPPAPISVPAVDQREMHSPPAETPPKRKR